MKFPRIGIALLLAIGIMGCGRTDITQPMDPLQVELLEAGPTIDTQTAIGDESADEATPPPLHTP